MSYRIAIIGVGAIANIHAKAIGDLANAELVGGCCRTTSKGREFSEKFGCPWYEDYGQMLDEQKPDVVTITTPSGAHLDPVLACAERGIHVLCEKPLEITSERIDQMIEVARRSDIRLGGIFPQRYNAVVQTLHRAAKQGRFGQVASINCYVPWWREDAYYSPDRWQGTVRFDGGGALINQSIHGVDAVQWIGAAANSGDPAVNPVAQVFAFTDKRGHDPQLIEVEDTATVVLKFRSGALGQILASTAMYPGSLKRIQVAGRDGTAEVLEDELITWQFRESLDEDESIRKRFGAKTATGGGAADPMAIDYSHHTRNIADFLDALDQGRSFLLDGPEARKAVVIIEAIYESARIGQVVTLR